MLNGQSSRGTNTGRSTNLPSNPDLAITEGLRTTLSCPVAGDTRSFSTWHVALPGHPGPGKPGLCVPVLLQPAGEVA